MRRGAVPGGLWRGGSAWPSRAASGDGWLAIAPLGARPTRADALSRAIPPHISFVQVPEAKTVKNRVHLDVTPVGTTQAEEIARITALGATPVDVGQLDVSWVVLADPEGNEFCVMSEWTED